MIKCVMMLENDMFTLLKTVHKSLIPHHRILNSVFTFASKTFPYSIHLVCSSFFILRRRIHILHSIQVRSHGVQRICSVYAYGCVI